MDNGEYQTEKRDRWGRLIREALKEYVYDDTRTIELLDKFEGIGEENPYVYDRLELMNPEYLWNDFEPFSVYLVIKRCKAQDCVGDITFTKYKKGDTEELRKYILDEITPEIVRKYKGTKSIFYFSKPYHLRAQNSNNRTGYGWEWDWSGGVGSYIEGTLYGETTDYGFVGAYIN